MNLSKLFNWVQSLLSANLPDDHPEIVKVRQVKTLNFIILLVIFLALPLPFHYYWIGVTWMVVGVSVAILFAVFILVLLRKTHNDVLCGHLAVLDFLWIILFSNFISGGFYDTSFATFYSVPVLAAFVAGIRGVFIYSVVAIVVTLGAFACVKIGIELPNMIPESDRDAQSLVNRLFGITMLASISIGFLFHRNFTEKLLQQSKAREEELHLSKSRFFASMSHEIRTPMNSVLGLSEMLQHSPLNEEQEQYVRSIRRSGNTLMTVINDILDYSLIESGKLSIADKSFDLKDLLNDIVETFNSSITDDVQFRVVIDSSVPQFVSGDSVRLYQVLSNLLNNSFKFTEEGYVRLTVEAEQHGGQWSLLFEIKDSGVGISEEGKVDLFEAYHRVMSHNDKNYGGTGLGLNICKYLVELMGGEIGCNSKAGCGTTMFFTIPLNDSQEVEKNESEQLADIEHGKGFSKIKVLVAEDNAANQLVVKAFLNKLSIDFDICEDGSQVYEALTSGHQVYDLLLLDCEMPVMDGFETANKIRGWEEVEGRTPIFICAFTAHVVDEVIARCYDSGMNSYIAKPLEMKNLTDVLNLVIDNKFD